MAAILTVGGAKQAKVMHAPREDVDAILSLQDTEDGRDSARILLTGSDSVRRAVRLVGWWRLPPIAIA